MDLEKIVNQLKEKEDSEIKQAFENTPENYHDFIMTLEHKQTIVNFEMKNISKELQDLGVEAWGGKTRLKINKPYMVVAGKVRWFADNHIVEEDGKRKIYKYNISSNIEKICDIIESKGNPPKNYPYIIKIESELYGTLEGESSINWNQSNCLEDAKTSALGRAITTVGIGAIGSGLSSYEEVINFINNADKKDNNKTGNNRNKNNKGKNNKTGSNSKNNNNESVSDKPNDYKQIPDGITKEQAINLYKASNEDKKLLAKIMNDLGYEQNTGIMLIKAKDYDEFYTRILDEMDNK